MAPGKGLKTASTLVTYPTFVFGCSSWFRRDEELCNHRTRHQGCFTCQLKLFGWMCSNADFLLMKYRSALPKVWSSFSIWNETAVSVAPGNYCDISTQPF
jgi:hypothetical protein